MAYGCNKSEKNHVSEKITLKFCILTSKIQIRFFRIDKIYLVKNGFTAVNCRESSGAVRTERNRFSVQHGQIG